MPLVYIPDHTHSPFGPSSYGGQAQHPLFPTPPHSSYAPSPYAPAHVDPIAARKQALIAEFAQSLDQHYPSSSAPHPQSRFDYGQQQHYQQLLQQEQKRIERQQAEKSYLKALEKERVMAALQAAAAEERRKKEKAKRQRRQEEEREKELLQREIQRVSLSGVVFSVSDHETDQPPLCPSQQFALRQHLLQQRQAAYEQHVQEARLQQIAAQRQRSRQQVLLQQQRSQEQQRRSEATHPLENFLNLIGASTEAEDEKESQAQHEVRLLLGCGVLRHPQRLTSLPSLPQQDPTAAIEAFFGQLFQHCAPAEAASAKGDKQTEGPAAAYHYIPHPSVAGPSAPVQRPSTPPHAATSNKPVTPTRSVSPPRSPVARTTPHQKLSALFTRLRSAASTSNSLKELQFHLTNILVEADGVESDGDAGIRSRRKELVAEVEKVLTGLEKKEKGEAAEESQSVERQPTPSATVDEPAQPTQAEVEPTPSAIEFTPAPVDHSLSPAEEEDSQPTLSPAPVLIPISSPPSSPVVQPTTHEDDTRSDAGSDHSNLASPLHTSTELKDDDDAKSVSSSTSSRRGRKATVEDAPDEDGFQMI